MPANHNIPHTTETKRRMSIAHTGVPALWKRRPSKVENGFQIFRCGKCLAFYPTDDFYRSRRSPFGITSECKTCHKSTVKASLDPEKKRIRGKRDEANRRAREGGRKVSAADYRGLEDVLGSICQKCGNGASLHWDHILPLSKGGLHHPINIQRLCGTCNVRKQASCLDYRSDAQIKAIKKRWVVEFNHITS